MRLQFQRACTPDLSAESAATKFQHGDQLLTLHRGPVLHRLLSSTRSPAAAADAAARSKAWSSGRVRSMAPSQAVDGVHRIATHIRSSSKGLPLPEASSSLRVRFVWAIGQRVR